MQAALRLLRSGLFRFSQVIRPLLIRSTRPFLGVGDSLESVRHCRPNPEHSFEGVAGQAMRPGLRQRSLAFARIADRHSRERARSWLAPFGTANASLEVFTDEDAHYASGISQPCPGQPTG